MSWDPCPECKRPTEVVGQTCRRCSGRHQDTTEIVDSICRHAEQKQKEPSATRGDDIWGK